MPAVSTPACIAGHDVVREAEAVRKAIGVNLLLRAKQIDIAPTADACAIANA